MTSTELTSKASEESTTQTVTSNNSTTTITTDNKNNEEHHSKPYSEGRLSPEKQSAATVAASLDVLSAHTKQKLPEDPSPNNSPKITKKSKQYKGSQPVQEDRFQYNCKFWVNTGHCRNKDTTCKWRHDEARRNVWPWAGNQDDVFPDLKGVYSE